MFVFWCFLIDLLLPSANLYRYQIWKTIAPSLAKEREDTAIRKWATTPKTGEPAVATAKAWRHEESQTLLLQTLWYLAVLVMVLSISSRIQQESRRRSGAPIDIRLYRIDCGWGVRQTTLTTSPAQGKDPSRNPTNISEL